jgi:hypothetical protein
MSKRQFKKREREEKLQAKRERKATKKEKTAKHARPR